MPDAPLVVVNPAAGGGRAARLLPRLREWLTRRPGGRLVVTRGPGQAVARRIVIEGAATTRIHLDGEPFGCLPLAVSLVPGAINVAAGSASRPPGS